MHIRGILEPPHLHGISKVQRSCLERDTQRTHCASNTVELCPPCSQGLEVLAGDALQPPH